MNFAFSELVNSVELYKLLTDVSYGKTFDKVMKVNCEKLMKINLLFTKPTPARSYHHYCSLPTPMTLARITNPSERGVYCVEC